MDATVHIVTDRPNYDVVKAVQEHPKNRFGIIRVNNQVGRSHIGEEIGL